MKNRNIEHKDDWKTPEEFYKKLDSEFNFDFDPCPLHHNIEDWDGLKIEWGRRNFVNPPYSRSLKEKFILKGLEESQKGNIVVMLLPVSTSTRIFHEVILPNCEIRFIRGRLSFEGVNTKGEKVGKGSKPMHDSMVIIFREKNVN